MAALLRTDEPVRVLKALRKLRGVNEAALPAVREALGHPDAEARENACEALAEMGPIAKDALPRLRELLQDPSPKVREEAERAVKALGPAEKP
jgi:HEAT repeat protein